MQYQPACTSLPSLSKYEYHLPLCMDPHLPNHGMQEHFLYPHGCSASDKGTSSLLCNSSSVFWQNIQSGLAMESGHTLIIKLSSSDNSDSGGNESSLSLSPLHKEENEEQDTATTRTTVSSTAAVLNKKGDQQIMLHKCVLLLSWDYNDNEQSSLSSSSSSWDKSLLFMNYNDKELLPLPLLPLISSSSRSSSSSTGGSYQLEKKLY